MEWSNTTAFGGQLIDIQSLITLFLRLIFNTTIILLVVKFLYSKNSLRKDFFLSYFALGTTIFLLTYILSGVKIELGFALGIFAIFGILRYRTDSIPVREMTYLFVIIALSVINAVTANAISVAELLLANVAILAIIWILEFAVSHTEERVIEITYNRIDNLTPEKRSELEMEITKTIGFKPQKITIERINYLKDTAVIKIYY